MTTLPGELVDLVSHTHSHLRHKEKTCTTSLPIEIIWRIFMQLDYPSLLTIKQICRIFYSITKSHQFWHDHVDRLCEDYGMTPPEEEIEEYNEMELERWVLRRYRALDVYAATKRPRLHKRTVGLQSIRQHTISHGSSIGFIPGGRWFLSGQRYPSVYVLDLESSHPKPKLLFDARDCVPDFQQMEPIDYRLWIDRKSSRLSFRVSGSIRRNDHIQTFIYQVELVGHGQNATLVASKIALFRTSIPTAVFLRGGTLNDHYLVLVWCYPTEPGSRRDPRKRDLEIYDYQQARPSSIHPSDIFSVEKFFHDDILLLTCMNPISFRVCKVETQSSIKFLHDIRIPSFTYWRSRWTHRASYITMMHPNLRGQLERYTIPHDTHLLPTVVELGHVDRHTFNPRISDFEIGFNASLSTYSINDHTRWIVNHQQNLTGDHHAPTHLSKKDVYLPRWLIGFDEDIGRSLYFQGGNELAVVDMT